MTKEQSKIPPFTQAIIDKCKDKVEVVKKQFGLSDSDIYGDLSETGKELLVSIMAACYSMGYDDHRNKSREMIDTLRTRISTLEDEVLKNKSSLH